MKSLSTNCNLSDVCEDSFSKKFAFLASDWMIARLSSHPRVMSIIFAVEGIMEATIEHAAVNIDSVAKLPLMQNL